MKIKSIVIAIMMLAFTAQAQFMHTKWNKLTSSVADSTGGYIPFANGVYWRSASSGKFLWFENGVVKTLGAQPSTINSLQSQIDAKISNPMTTLGDIIYGGSSGTPTRLGIGTNAYVLTVNSGVPSWQPSSAGITNSSATNEIPKTNASGNLVASGLESTSAGDLNLGRTLTTSGTGRNVNSAGSATDIAMTLSSKGSGTNSLRSPSGAAVLQSGSTVLNWTNGVLTSANGTLFGLGTGSPDRLFHIENSGALTSSVKEFSRITHITSGTATSGFGALYNEVELEGGGGTNVIASKMETIWSNAGATSSDIIFYTNNTGSLAERVRFASTGAVGFNGANYGTSGQVLTSNGPTSSPSWGPVTLGGLAIDTIQIGDWNMDATNSIQVDLSSIGVTKIRGIKILIKEDNDATDDSNVYSFTEPDTGFNVNGSYIIGVEGITGIVDPGKIYLTRRLASIFDSSSFNATSYNRGWIIVFYVP